MEVTNIHVHDKVNLKPKEKSLAEVEDKLMELGE